MIIRGTPKDKDLCDYIKVDDDIGYKLQKMGFFPIYIDNKFLYFKNCEQIKEVVNEEYEKGKLRTK